MKIKFEQKNNNSARAKFARMASGAGRRGNYFSCGFASWTLENDPDFPEPGQLAIFCYTTYHSEISVNNMYKSNCKKW